MITLSALENHLGIPLHRRGGSIWILGILLLASPSSSHAAEARCGALGAACVCSEPLNAQMTVSAQTFVDPPDSTTKECGGERGDSMPVYSGGGGASVAEFGMPAGNLVNWVVRFDGGSGTVVAHVTGNHITYTSGTVCSRIYQRFSSDFPNPLLSLDQRAKLMEFDLKLPGGSRVYSQSQWDFASPRFKLETVGFGIDSDVPWVGSTVTLNDCRNSWCRMEQCIDKYSDGRVNARARVAVLNTGSTMTFTSPAGNQTASVTVDPAWIGLMYRQNLSAGYRYASYAIQAYWPQANGATWIGPASEVESGGTVSPPPATTTPPAPVLLP